MSSVCGSCKGSRWELVEESPEKSRFKFFFVRCATCRVPVGVTSYYDIHEQIQKIDKKNDSLFKGLALGLDAIRADFRRYFQR